MIFSTDHFKLWQNLRRPTEKPQWVFVYWFRIHRVSEILIKYCRVYENDIFMI